MLKQIAESKGCGNESLLFLLLAHHRSDELHRTIRISLGKRDIYICARGLGRYSGLMATFILNNFIQIPLWFYSFSFVFSPLPSMVDWATQKVGWRESRNEIRVPTGFLLGFGQGFLIISFLKGLTPIYNFGMIVLLVYFICFCIARYWKRGVD